MVSLMKTMIPGFGRTGFGRDEIDSLVGTVWIPEIPQNQDEKNIEKPPVPNSSSSLLEFSGKESYKMLTMNKPDGN